MNVLRMLCFLCSLIFAIPAYAQITGLVSPGELSKAHSKFSGVKNCNVCHGGKKDVLDIKCLDCHKELKARIEARKGFHADKSTRCVKCHTEHLGEDYDIRQFDTAKFDHKESGWTLTGKHAEIKQCSACHKTRSFLGLSTDCKSCHKDPHKGRLLNCENCHPIDRPFKQAVFDHSATRFQLEGAHSNVACMTCHKDQVFRGLPFATCVSCHKDPHRGSLGQNCVSCHSVTTWKAPKVAHKTFPLEGKHANVACAKCHVNNQWKLKAFAKCSDCHRDPHRGRFVQACEQCHNVQGFKPSTFAHEKFQKQNVQCVSCHLDKHSGQMGIKCEQCHTTTTFKIPKFDHTKTRFPLDQVHLNLACEKCHVPDPMTQATRYRPLPLTCAGCHRDVHMGQLSSNCESCHTPAGLKFDHAKTTYPLTGKHSALECAKCHRKESGKFPAGAGEAVRYKFATLQCRTCHGDYHRGQFKQQDCVSCHTTAGFKPSTFNHQISMFPLTGAHLNLACEKCHPMQTVEAPAAPAQLMRYSLGSSKCSSCHQDPHSGKFGLDCQKCHGTIEWTSVSRAFHKEARFPLEGKHLSTRCESCHWNGQFEGTPERCYDCHWIRRQDDLYRTQLGTNCEECHNPSGWTAVRWNHAARTGLALGSNHNTLNCDACHTGGNFTQPATGCYSCHREDYDQTTSPAHAAAGFPTTCESCHRPADSDWETLAFAHTTYPLVGVHRTTACAECHKNNVYQGTPRDCYGCHKTDYQNTTDPNHQRAGFSTQCDTCHLASDSDWHQPGFNHNQIYPLQGQHATLQCSACHINGVYAGTPRDCYGCHKTDYNQTTNPNHAKANFPTTCEVCHSAKDPNWNQAKFNHDSVYPLKGQHRTLQCNACHKNGVYTGTPRHCYGCHKADYDQTNNPNHKTAGFGTTCETCHKAGDANWNQGKFDHKTVYPLLGKHATAACTQCHKNGIYAGTPRDCYSCHKAEYNQTTNPNHQAAGFPTTCDSCHRAADSSWLQGRFTHTWFPIASGNHSGFSCQQCHPNSSDFKVFDCLSCHPRSQVDPQHTGVGGYTYTSQACYNCHPTGQGD